MPSASLITASEFAELHAAHLDELSARLLQRIRRDQRDIDCHDAMLEKLASEMAQLNRLKYGNTSERP